MVKLLKQTNMQLDHIHGEHSLLTLEDVVPFAQIIDGVTEDEVMVLLCIQCHAGCSRILKDILRCVEDASKDEIKLLPN